MVQGVLDAPTIGKISLAVGAYVAVNTNLRYQAGPCPLPHAPGRGGAVALSSGGGGGQVVAGLIEQRGIDVVFRGLPAARTAGSTAVRMANTYLGSYFIVAYLKALGLQKVD